MSRVDLKQVWKIYPRGNVVGVKDLTFTCRDKEFLAILGPSGGGKSSTLRMLAGLEEISRGEILFDGSVVNHLGPAERNIALAFESYALYQRLTVFENIAFPLRAKGVKDAEVRKKVNSIAELLDLTSILKKYPSSLAGGQQQRVSLARSFVRKPNLNLLDEPISHMDQRVRAEIRARIRHLHNEMGNTTIYVTHDQAEAVSLCDRLVILHKAELQQIGTVEEIWNRPANRFVAYFVGEPAMNFLNGTVEDAHSVSIPKARGKHTLRFEGEIDGSRAGSGKPVAIGVRPQQVKVSRSMKGENSIPGTVKVIEFQGELTVLTVNIDDDKGSEMKAVVPASERYSPGDGAWFHFDPARIHLFDGDAPVIRKRETPSNGSKAQTGAR